MTDWLIELMEVLGAPGAVTIGTALPGPVAPGLGAVRRDGTMVVVRAQDDGVGGTDPAVGGLPGPARRPAAPDGRSTATGPVGGPVTISAEPSCG
ncbi:hypothetical protein [Planomonospora sphaerica]|nr:hypothetical protein [Planomonospora sphaerica]